MTYAKDMQKAFELSHILYMVFSIAIIIAVLIVIGKYCKTKRSKNIAIYITSALLLVVLLWNRISLAVLGDKYNDPSALLLLPFSYCAFTNLFMPICAMIMYKNRNHNVFHCLVYISMIGGIATTIYPAMIVGVESTIFATRTLSGMLHHSLGLFLALLLIVTREFTPNWRKAWCWLLGCCVIITFGLFQIQALGMENSMEISKPFIDDSKFFTWYWGGPTIGLGFVLAFALAYEYIPKFIKRKHN